MFNARDFIEAHLFSDLHKDTFGFRPNAYQYEIWMAMSEAELEAEYNDMCDAHEAELVRYQAAQHAAVERFEALIAMLLATGAADRATAIRWAMDAEGADEQDPTGYCEWTWNLPYGYLATCLAYA